jgi:hypothetical protein
MDLNKDDHLDIAAQVSDGSIKIWWGARSGFTAGNITEIDLERQDHLMYLKGADFNNDGWLDLLLPKRRPYEAKNTSFIYYGSADGFPKSDRSEILSHTPYDNTIVDFDGDGWLDIFLTSYGTDVTGNRPSMIHWGGPGGFSAKPVTEFRTHGSSGSEVLDYDGDGWLDIFVANHRKAGSNVRPIPHLHTMESQLFWGGPDGFSDDRRWDVIAEGPSGLNNRDPGNSYDRGLYEDYISSPHKIPPGETPASISWRAETPLGSSVTFQIRFAADKSDLQFAEWRGADGLGSWYTQPSSAIEGADGDWVQYRARLSTPNGGPTPYLTEVIIRMESDL